MKKKILVTGASRGIGRAIAEKFLDQGCIVYGTYKSSKKQMTEIEKKYGSDNFIICGPYDFSNIEETNAFVSSVLGIDFDTLVLSAGMFSDNDDFINFNLEDFNKVMNCNFYAPLIISTRLQSYIKNNGSIVLMSSNDSYSGAFGSMSYSISKSAVLSLLKCLCVNYGRRKIRVNSVSPGAINTDMNTPEQEFEAPLWTPIERIAQPYEVAEVVYFLANETSSFINGENITIDGGYSNVSLLLKKEIDRSRKIVGYDYLNSTMNNLKSGEIAYCLDMTPEYGWIDKKEEIEYIHSNIKAISNGAIVSRIIIASKEKLDEILSNNLIEYDFNNTKKPSIIKIVSEEDVKKKMPYEFSKFGKGFIVFKKENGKREVFIDSFSDENNVGYLIENDQISDQLEEIFLKLISEIEEKKIEVIK